MNLSCEICKQCTIEQGYNINDLNFNGKVCKTCNKTKCENCKEYQCPYNLNFPNNK